MLAAASITKIVIHRTASVFMLEEIHEAIASASRKWRSGRLPSECSRRCHCHAPDVCALYARRGAKSCYNERMSSLTNYISSVFLILTSARVVSIGTACAQPGAHLVILRTP